MPSKQKGKGILRCHAHLYFSEHMQPAQTLKQHIYHCVMKQTKRSISNGFLADEVSLNYDHRDMEQIICCPRPGAGCELPNPMHKPLRPLREILFFNNPTGYLSNRHEDELPKRSQSPCSRRGPRKIQCLPPLARRTPLLTLRQDASVGVFCFGAPFSQRLQFTTWYEGFLGVWVQV